MFFLITIFLTALVSALFGLLPGKLQRRSVIKQDIVWAVGLWLATWLFAVFAYHRPGLTIGFNAFRLVAVTALNGWAGFVTAGLRSFGRKGLKAVVPLLLVTALGLEVFVGNVAYFNTHSYEPFQLVDYLDENINVGRGLGTISLDEGRTYLRFLNIDRPIYNLRFDGLVNDDTDLLHADSAVTFTIDQGRVLSASGALLPETGTETSSGQKPLSAFAALTAFQQMRHASSSVVSSITEVSLCYELQSTTAAPMALVPSWRIVTDTATFYVNCISGTVRRA